MSFAATWMDPEIIVLSKIRERQSPCDIIYMWNVKHDTNQYIYKITTDS